MEQQAQPSFDVFKWANSVDEIKNNVSVELFLFNRNYIIYLSVFLNKLIFILSSRIL
jgi:hypothetical protein